MNASLGQEMTVQQETQVAGDGCIPHIWFLENRIADARVKYLQLQTCKAAFCCILGAKL